MAAVNGMAANVGAQVGAAAGAAAMQNAKQQMQMAPGGSDGYLYCIPVFPGFPTEHARSMKYCLRRILVFQLIMCLLRGMILRDILGGLWMFLTVFVGFHGYYENMNITYISCWGVLCTLNGFIDALHCILPLAFGLLNFDVFKVLIQVLCPFAYWLGATFAYHIYLDFVHERQLPTGMATHILPDIFWIMKQKADEHSLPLSAPAPGAQNVPVMPAGVQPGYGAQAYAGAPVAQQPVPAAPQPTAAQQQSYLEAMAAQAGAAAGAAAMQGAVAGAQQQAAQGFAMPPQQQAPAGYPPQQQAPAGYPPQQAAPAGTAPAAGGGGGWFHH